MEQLVDKKELTSLFAWSEFYKAKLVEWSKPARDITRMQIKDESGNLVYPFLRDKKGNIIRPFAAPSKMEELTNRYNYFQKEIEKYKKEMLSLT